MSTRDGVTFGAKVFSILSMIEVTQISEFASVWDGELVLTFEQRSKSRLRLRLDSGEELGILLARGTIMRDGQFIQNAQGHCYKVLAAEEALSRVEFQNMFEFARACYHLGNRHIRLQIGRDFLAYPRDHVLDQLMHSMGHTVLHLKAAFEPDVNAVHPH